VWYGVCVCGEWCVVCDCGVYGKWCVGVYVCMYTYKTQKSKPVHVFTYLIL